MQAPAAKTAATSEWLRLQASGMADAEAQPHRFRMSEKMEDAFDRHAVPNELIETWEAAERAALVIPAGPVARLVSAEVRRKVLVFMWNALVFVHLPQAMWFKAVTIFDYYVARAEDVTTLNDIPSLCIALVRMMQKDDDRSSLHQNDCQQGLRAGSTELVATLRSAGFQAREVTEASVDAREFDLLRALRWNIHFPTVESWLSTLHTRFNILTEFALTAPMSWVWQRIFDGTVQRIVMHSVPNSDASPQSLAIGFLGLGLAAAGLLPASALRPSWLELAEWEKLFLESQGWDVMPRCIFGPEFYWRIFEFYRVSVSPDCSHADLQEACGLAAAILRATGGTGVLPSSEQGGGKSQGIHWRV